MTVDNFNLIANIIGGKVLSEDTFFLVQCIRRHKDAGNEDMNANNIVVENFFINNDRELEEKKERIVKVCELNNARAYIRVNKRSYRKVALRTMAKIAEQIAQNNYQIKNAYLSTIGEFAEEKSFLIDVDYAEIDFNEQEMYEYISDLLMETKTVRPMMHKVPTKNGYHLITSGFNLAKFTPKYPSVSVHKDNPTILYVP
jgi:hypothetical protein